MHVKDKQGNNDMHLTCPVCGWEGTIYYSRRRPEYCSPACKQKAYRMRQRKAQDVTPTEFEDVTNLPKPQIERNLDQTLHLMRCSCGRGIWTIKGNTQIGHLHCTLCHSDFHPLGAGARPGHSPLPRPSMHLD